MENQRQRAQLKRMSNSQLKIRAIILSAGIGKRFGSPDKVFIEINGKPLFISATQAFEEVEEIDSIFLVTRKEMFETAKGYIEKFQITKIKQIIEGGKERQDSVYNALKSMPDDTDIVLIHDGARPLVTKDLLERVLKALTSSVDGAIPVIPVTDTIKWMKSANIVGGTLNREMLKAVQTPQVFWFKKLLKAYEKAYKEGFYGTDDASLIERYGGKVVTVDGEPKNIKITTKEDLLLLTTIHHPLSTNLRIGIGYDSHRFEEGRKLIIGGVEIPYHLGLKGHSDADVLTHAIIDALLGSAGMGDIGTHFPDTAPAYRDISSLVLLENTLNLLKNHQIEPIWVDCTIFAEKPKLSPYIPKMKENFQKLGLNVNIKAKTNEGMGFIGRQEGIAAQAICLNRFLT